MLEYGLLCFTALLAMVNPFGIAPVFQPMTHDMPRAQAQQVAFRASLAALGLLIFFAVAGSFVFSVSVSSLRIVGGIIFFLLGYELLQAKLSRMKTDGLTIPTPTATISLLRHLPSPFSVGQAPSQT